MGLALRVKAGEKVKIGPHIAVTMTFHDLRSGEFKMLVEAPPELEITSSTKRARPVLRKQLVGRDGRVLP